MLTSTFNNHPISSLNSSAKIVINALPGAEVVHERMSRNLLVLVRKRIHQIMNFTQISLLRIWHRVSYLSPALGIAQSRASYQFHNLICGLDCGNRAIQKLMDERCSSSLCLLDNILTIGLFALGAGNENPHVLLVVTDAWVGLAAVALKFGTVVSPISLITIADLILEPSEHLGRGDVSVWDVFSVHAFHFQHRILFNDHDPRVLVVSVFGKEIFWRMGVFRQLRADLISPQALNNIDASSA